MEIEEESMGEIPQQESVDESEIAFKVQQVKKAIEKLPDGYRTVLTLYLLEGYDHQEIAEIMSISESTSKSQLNRAKTKLRELLEIRVKD